jgi:hypothetical protein
VPRGVKGPWGPSDLEAAVAGDGQTETSHETTIELITSSRPRNP